MPTSAKQGMKRLLEQLAEHGCEAQVNGSGHVKVTRGSKTLTLPTTPSDHRAVLNAYATARRVFGIAVYQGSRPKKRKESADDFAMSRIRSRIEKQQNRGVSIADLARLAIAVAEEKGIPTWKNLNSANEGISVILRDPSRRLTKVRHDALAAALNRIENADENVLKGHLEWAAKKTGKRRITGHGLKKIAAVPAPKAEETPEEPKGELVRIARDVQHDDEGPTMVVNIELGPATRSLLRELLNALGR